MSTTALFVEIMIIGAIADIWLFLIVFAVVSPDVSFAEVLLTSVSSLGNLIIFPILGVTYVVGFCMNFISDYFFRCVIQQKIREKVISESELKNIDYYYIRSYFSQKASELLSKDWCYTRHSIRIARSSVLNFFFIAIIFLLYICIGKSSWGVIVSFILCIFISLAALWQATTLSKTNYKRLIQDYIVLREINKDDSTQVLDKNSMG